MEMFFSLVTIAIDGIWIRQLLDLMVLEGCPVHHWSNDAVVRYHRCSLAYLYIISIIPDICQLWYTYALYFGLYKYAQKCIDSPKQAKILLKSTPL